MWWMKRVIYGNMTKGMAGIRFPNTKSVLEIDSPNATIVSVEKQSVGWIKQRVQLIGQSRNRAKFDVKQS